MAISVIMPALDMAQDTGKLLAWHKGEGDAVSKGELLMSVETDKAVVELEAEGAGILAGVRAREGDVIAVGQVVAWILAPGEKVPAEAPSPDGPRLNAGSASSPPKQAPRVAVPLEADVDRPLLSPKARRLAAERGLDLRGIKGSGPGGAIVAADLGAKPAPAAESVGTVWRVMADRVRASWTTVPHFFLTRDVNASALAEAHARLKQVRPAGSGGTITYTDQLVALAARVLRQHPRLNASWAEGAIRYNDVVNMGIATAVEQGILVPVIHGADRLLLHDIAQRRYDLVERAKAGRLQPADMAQGTFTISNLGMYGVDAFNAIINPPEAAILAVGRIADRVVALDGRPAVCAMMTLTLSCDHRVADGARAAEFLADLAGAIERPDSIL